VGEGALFWSRIAGAVTAPQYVGLRLGRPPGLTSTAASLAFACRAQRNPAEWDTVPLTREARLVGRTHDDVLFRLVPDLVRRPLGTSNPLASVMTWAWPELVFEGRYILAGLPRDGTRADRAERLARALRAGVAQGYVRDLTPVAVPRFAYGPSRKQRRLWGLGRGWVVGAAPEHLALALDAALALWWGREGVDDPIERVATEPGLLAAACAAAARTRGRRFAQRGPRTGEISAIDAELRLRSGRDVRVELIARSYSKAEIAAKGRGGATGPAAGTVFVCTSPTVAARAAHDVPYLRYQYL
jgi:hypothetical protein